MNTFLFGIVVCIFATIICVAEFALIIAYPNYITIGGVFLADFIFFKTILNY